MAIQSLANISTFVQVAACGGFAEAANRMGVSASATSKGVARLEEELGVKLLHRTTRSVSLTVEGERFFEGSRKLLEEMEALTGEITDSLDAPRGRLVVSAPSVFGRTWLTGRVIEFMRLYPKIEVELAFDDRTVDLAAEGVDVAIRVGQLGDSANIVARKLYETPIFTVASPDYIRRRGAPESIDDLDAHEVLHYRVPTTGRLMPFVFATGEGREQRTFDPALVANSVDATHDAAVAGVGVAQIATFLASDSFAKGDLVELLPNRRFPTMPVSILYLDRRLVSPRIRALVDFLIADPPRFALPETVNVLSAAS